MHRRLNVVVGRSPSGTKNVNNATGGPWKVTAFWGVHRACHQTHIPGRGFVSFSPLCLSFTQASGINMTLECAMDMPDPSAAASTETLASSSISLDTMQSINKNSIVTESTSKAPTQETISRRANTTCVSPPKMFESSFIKLEYSIHVSPKRMTRELITVFPGRDLANLLVVPTFQRCGNQMVAWDAAIAKEKDDRLEDVCCVT